MKHCKSCAYCILSVKVLNVDVVIHKCYKKKHLIMHPFFSGFRCNDYVKDGMRYE